MEENKTNVKQEIKTQTIGYILAALGLVAGLAWNDAIKALIDFLIPLSGGSIGIKFLYAVLVTVIIVVVSTYLLKKNKN